MIGGDKMLNQNQKRELMQRRGWICQYCGKRVNTSYGEIHHTNRDPNDDRPQNLKVACSECHQRITARYR